MFLAVKATSGGFHRILTLVRAKLRIHSIYAASQFIQNQRVSLNFPKLSLGVIDYVIPQNRPPGHRSTSPYFCRAVGPGAKEQERSGPGPFGKAAQCKAGTK